MNNNMKQSMKIMLKYKKPFLKKNLMKLNGIKNLIFCKAKYFKI